MKPHISDFGPAAPQFVAGHIPYYLTQFLLKNPDINPVGQVQSFEAVALFVDVSGFTALCEALTGTGVNGVEELTHLLNAYFDAMIELVEIYGGFVAKFAGDSLTALFPLTAFIAEAEHSNPKRQDVVLRALTCALEMQNQMDHYSAVVTSAGAFRLEMKAGLAIGPVFCTTVGVLSNRLEYVIAGLVLDRCAEAEHHTRSGEVLIGRADLLPFASEVVTAPVKNNSNFVRVLAVPHPPPPAPLPKLQDVENWPDNLKIVLDAFQHPLIAQRLAAGQASFVNEHRRVTTLFVAFDGFDYDHDPNVADKLQNYLVRVIEVVKRYDGYLRQVDMGDKGSKYIVLFGAPVAHENDEERALRCALDLRGVANELNIVTRTGINTGQVFCGMVGSAGNRLRQEYSMLGDGVNLAARLMQMAQANQLLIGESTHLAAGTSAFSWEELAPVRVKGRRRPLVVYALTTTSEQPPIRLQEPHYSLPLVGREAELSIIKQKLEEVLERKGQIIGVMGEAGIGKSRLVSEVVHLARERWIVGYGGECQSFGTNISYLVWQNIWQAFFGVDPSATLQSQTDSLKQQLNLIDPALIDLLPLLGPVLNLSIPDNEVTRSLEGKLRKTSLETMLIDCLRGRTVHAPMLLVLEDCHWIDVLSFELLQEISLTIANLPILLVVAYRTPETKEQQDRLSRLEKLDYFTSLKITDFSEKEAHKLIELKLDQIFGSYVSNSKAYPSLVARIKSQAQGNPFYIEELINLLRDRQVDLQDKNTLEKLELPGSLQSLVISRIDNLRETTKLTLKVASVIGRFFKASWLWGFYPQLGLQEQVKAELDILSQMDITPLDSTEPELEYLFKHIVTREVAYESLALATRAMLHERLAVFIEATFGDRLDQYLDLLAYHYGFSNNVKKKCEYFRKAGEVAQSIYANQTAIDYYQKLLPLLPINEQLGFMLKIGQIWQLMGNWTEAESIFRKALPAAHTETERANCQARVGALLWRKGEYAEAYHWLEQAWGIFVSIDDLAGISLCVSEMGIAASSQGNYTKAQKLLLDGLTLSRQQHDKSGVVTSLYHLGDAVSSQGDYEAAKNYYQEGLNLSRELKDKPAIIRNLNGLGIVACSQGEYDTARTFLAESQTLSRQIGNKRGLAVVLNTLGDVTYMQGEFSTAYPLYQESLALCRTMGDRPGIAYALMNLGRAKCSLGDYETSQSFYAETLDLGRELGNNHIIAYCLAGFANIATAVNDLSRGVRLAGTTSALLEKIGAVMDTAEQADYNWTMAVLRSQLDDTEFEEGWSEGTQWSLEQGIEFALATDVIVY